MKRLSELMGAKEPEQWVRGDGWGFGEERLG